ncbi:TPA: GIY-YIG nuclease family protein, partial [Clostridium perfringens]
LTISNKDNSRKRLEAAKEQINKLVSSYYISINMDYFKLKVEELQLQYEYLVKIQEEREEQREIKERMREEAKVQAEINKLEKEAEKEEKMYQKALEKVRAELEKANDEEKAKLEIQVKNLEENLRQAEEKMKRAESMAQKTKAGYVYVISNIGSFGEDIYKIGLTRRLDPMERVKELSDASVPFKFDVHAMIYSEDAPALERELHNHFASKRLNKVNLRKEFFNVKLSDIEEIVNRKMNTTIKFTKLAEALEYRQSKLM